MSNDDKSDKKDDFDFSAMDDDFANAKAETKKEPPDGKYIVGVAKAELAKAKTTGNAMLKWQLRILTGEYAGRMLFRNNMITSKENLAWLKGDLKVCGLEITKVSELNANLHKLLDLKLEVTKKSKGENSNVYLNKLLGKIEPGEGEPVAGPAGPDTIPF